MVVYSVTWVEFESPNDKRKWFASERDATKWMGRKHKWKHGVMGPHRHVIEGKVGLMNFIKTHTR